ncbi:Uncharacterized protein SCF082_LOCUS3036 [Durusdinium trenchii]|uniref:Transcription factor CBF/NF-Y/archaeal histone domain-containing protein n=1 Tax=Durusdinium trenchii TaxID=1381693 RepID=A0ABP0HS87_9DINO
MSADAPLASRGPGAGGSDADGAGAATRAGPLEAREHGGQAGGMRTLQNCERAAEQDPHLLLQLRQVLLSAEKQAFDNESSKRRTRELERTIEELEKGNEERDAQLQQARGKLNQMAQFAEQQKNHICRLQKAAQDEKKVRAGLEKSMEAFRSRIEELDLNLEAKEATGQNALQDLEQARSRVTSLEKDLKERERQFHDARVHFETRVSELQKHCVDMQRQCTDANTKNKSLQVQVRSLETQVQSLVELKEEAHSKLESAEDLNKKQEQEITRLRNDIAHHESTNASLKDKAELGSKEISGLQKQLSASKARLDLAEEKQSERELLHNAKEQQWRNKLDALQVKLKEQDQEARSKLDKVRADLEQESASSMTLRTELESAAKARDRLQTRIEGLQEEIEAHSACASDQAAALQVQLKTMQEERDQERTKNVELQEQLCVVNDRLDREVSRRKNDSKSRASAEAEFSQKLDQLRIELTRAQIGKEKESNRAKQAVLDHGKVMARLGSLEQAMATSGMEEEQVKRKLGDQVNRLGKQILSLQQAKSELEETLSGKLEDARQEHTIAEEKWAEERKSLKQKADQAQNEVQRKSNDLAALEKERDRLSTELQESQKSVRACEAQMLAGTKALKQLKIHGAEWKDKAMALSGQLNMAKETARKVQEEQAKLYRAQLREVSEKLDDTKRSLEQQKGRSAEAEQSTNRLQQTTASQILSFNEKIRALSRSNEALQSELAALHSGLKLSKQREASATEANEKLLSEMKSRQADFNEQLTAASAAMQAIRRDKAQLELERVRLQDELNDARLSQDRHKDDWQGSIKTLKRQKQELETELDHMKSSQTETDAKLRRFARENAELRENEARRTKAAKGPKRVLQGKRPKSASRVQQTAPSAASILSDAKLKQRIDDLFGTDPVAVYKHSKDVDLLLKFSNLLNVESIASAAASLLRGVHSGPRASSFSMAAGAHAQEQEQGRGGDRGDRVADEAAKRDGPDAAEGAVAQGQELGCDAEVTDKRSSVEEPGPPETETESGRRERPPRERALIQGSKGDRAFPDRGASDGAAGETRAVKREDDLEESHSGAAPPCDANGDAGSPASAVETGGEAQVNGTGEASDRIKTKGKNNEQLQERVKGEQEHKVEDGQEAKVERDDVADDDDRPGGHGAEEEPKIGQKRRRHMVSRHSLVEGEGEVIRSGTIKRIMKLDKDVRMTSAEAVFLVSKASEIFLGECAVRALDNANGRNQKLVVKYQDLCKVLRETERFAVLKELLPDISKHIK